MTISSKLIISTYVEISVCLFNGLTVCPCALLESNEIVMVTSLSQAGRNLGLLEKQIHASLFSAVAILGGEGKMEEKGSYSDKHQNSPITEAKVI